MQRSRLICISIASILGSVVLVPAAGTSAPRYSGTITGSFDAPVLSGAFLCAVTHAPIPRENAGTAARSEVGAATIAWGADDNGGPSAASSLTFGGDSFTDVTPGQVFRLGTLTFANGPSGPASLIFGFDMELSAGDGVTPFGGSVEIISTQNANVDRIADADVLSFADFDAPSTLAAFENAAVTANLYGRIGDDGRLAVTSIALAPDEAEHGCVDEASTRPCAPAAIASAFTQPLCGSEELPAVLSRRIRSATGRLGQGASAANSRKTKRTLRLAMRQLRSSAALATRAASRGHLSEACAQAIRSAVANAESQTATR